MNIFDSLKGHSVVEANNLTGLRIGHMVAQAKYGGVEEEGLDNGVILALNEKNELVRYTGEGQAFLHYSEEHMKFLDNAPLEMFTVPAGQGVDAYPRAIALYEGDTFTTDAYNKDGGYPEAGEYFAVTVEEGLLTVGAKATAADNAICKAATLPAGQKAIEVIWRGGRA